MTRFNIFDQFSSWIARQIMHIFTFLHYNMKYLLDAQASWNISGYTNLAFVLKRLLFYIYPSCVKAFDLMLEIAAKVK